MGKTLNVSISLFTKRNRKSKAQFKQRTEENPKHIFDRRKRSPAQVTFSHVKNFITTDVQELYSMADMESHCLVNHHFHQVDR
jgi:hypothetical protein